MRDRKTHFRVAVQLLLLVCASTGCIFQVVMPRETVIALKTHHDKYLTAQDEEGGWMLTQEDMLTERGKFTQRHLANGKVTLMTHYGKYVVAPDSGIERRDWLLKQERRPGRCGQFELYRLGNDRVAYRTCEGRFFTAGNETWDPLWSVAAETQVFDDWEELDLEEQ